MIRRIALLLALAAGAAAAEEPRITNEASGLACYSPQELLDVHHALGFYNMERVQEFIRAERCFVMKPEWRVMRIDSERFIGGVEVTMVEMGVEVDPGRDARTVWTLAGNVRAD